MKFAWVLAFAAVFFLSCGKNSDPIPNVSVNFELPLSDPRLTGLNIAGGVVLISGYGVAGLIIYREPDGSYVAYDRCSSYQPEKHCAVTVDQPGFTATDPCSGSMFSMADGTPVKAPATKSLRQYAVSVSNFEIFVSN